MVVWVAEGGGVGEHDGGVADLPEGPLVGPGDAGYELGDGAAFGWEFAIAAKRGDCLVQ